MAAELESVGRYQILEEIGTGSRGMVYKCFDPILKRDVAVKTPSNGPGEGALPCEDTPQSVVAGFYHEAEIGAQFQHANIVMVHDVGKGVVTSRSRDDYSSHFLVMELASSVSLKNYLQKHKQLPVEEVLHVISDCCKAIEHMHYRGILHRDIKPGNIIYDPSSRSVKLTDFSISGYIGDLSDKSTGTLPYSSPEHFLDDEELSFQSDFFSLGSVMYELLTGACPFLGTSVKQVASRIVSANPVPAREFRDDLPRQIEFILLKAMSKSRRDRFQGSTEFSEALDLALSTTDIKRK